MRKRAVLLPIVLLLLLTSCVTKMPYGYRQYFQAMGLDGEFVITVNAALFDTSKYIDTDDKAAKFINDRMERLSIALYDSKGTSGPVVSDFSEFDYYGAIEGSFSGSLVNSALSLSGLFAKQKDKDTGLKFFRDEQSGLEAAVPANGIILFSSGDVTENYSRTFTKTRENLISDEDAERLASSQIGIYIANPRTMIDLGFEISESALKNISTILMVMDDEKISVEFRLLSEDLAESFAVIIKAAYVGNLRREGAKLNIPELRKMFTQELDTVNVNGMPLSKEQKDSINEVLSSLLGMF